MGIGPLDAGDLQRCTAGSFLSGIRVGVIFCVRGISRAEQSILNVTLASHLPSLLSLRPDARIEHDITVRLGRADVMWQAFAQ